VRDRSDVVDAKLQCQSARRRLPVESISAGKMVEHYFRKSAAIIIAGAKKHYDLQIHAERWTQAPVVEKIIPSSGTRAHTLRQFDCLARSCLQVLG
jgi:hypothetical protein